MPTRGGSSGFGCVFPGMAKARPMPAGGGLSPRFPAFSPVGRLLAAILSGAVAALGQAPFGLWPTTILGLALVYGLFRVEMRWQRATLLGLAAGTGYFLVALSWIVEPFLVDVARHGWMAPFALVFLAAGMGLFWALAFGAARAAGGGAAAWVGAFVLIEALRGRFMTGFPWAQTGHAWIDTPMLHWASWGGALALTGLMMGAAVAGGHLLAGRRGAGVVGLIVIAALFVAGAGLAPDAGARDGAPIVRLVQPNAAQHEKWDPDKVQVFFDRQMRFTAAAGAEGRPDLVVWPETAIPVLLNNADATLASIAAAAQGAPVMLGLRRLDGPRIYNSLVLLDDRGGVVSLYDKHHLVPFGEYVPLGDLLGRVGIHGLAAGEGGGFSAGPGPQVIGMGDLGRALPLICYEGVFPRNIVQAPERPDFLMLLTNDAWFGQVSGPYQHLAQARLRSAEQGLPMVRVANTGVSAVIDGAGRISARIALNEEGWIDAALPPPLPPTVYARTGDLPVLALTLVLLATSLIYNAAGARRR